jgi:flagella synthesis protein FlgN
MPHADSARQNALDAEIGAWQALLDILRDEEQALVRGDAERVAQITPIKLAQVDAIGTHVRTRQTALLAAGHSATSAGMAAWVGKDPAQGARLRRLDELEAAAQAANQRVGALVDMRLGAARQAMNVLVRAATRGNALYDESGQAVAARSGKPLSAA